MTDKPAQPQRTQSAQEFYKANAMNIVNVPRPGHPEDKSGWDGVRRASKTQFIAKDVLVMPLWDVYAFAEAYAHSLKQAAVPTEPVADPSKEELKAECEMLREELCYHRDYWAEWNMRALTAHAQKEELKTALGRARDYVVGLSAYLATYATATIIENLETTITSLHKERDYLERLLSGDGKE